MQTEMRTKQIMKEMYAQLGISSEVYDFGHKIEESLKERFEKFDKTAEYNQMKVLLAMQKNKVSAECFGSSSGYGYDDIGRETLEKVYADTFHTEAVSGIPASWPGYDLTIGVTGEKVQQIQEQLNAIAKAYPAIPSVIVDGIYGPATAASVKKFQNIFGLPASGVVDYPTWYKIQDIYVAVTRIAELQ